MLHGSPHFPCITTMAQSFCPAMVTFVTKERIKNNKNFFMCQKLYILAMKKPPEGGFGGPGRNRP